MLEALNLARARLGQVAPNPAVGCVIVKDGRIVGHGATARSGRPHAEPQACAMAGDQAQGATAYVTLEPCSHHGQTPPCALALGEARIKRVVVACMDPDERVNGKGLDLLRANGITVETGLREHEARALNKGFFLRVQQQRPLITLKIATSLDGMIALASGESKWITSPEAREEAHRERARHDAVLTGIGTVLADDPLLTVRLPDTDHQPVRIVMDSQLQLPLQSKLAQSARDHPVWVIGENPGRQTALEDMGITALPLRPYDVRGMLAELAARGLTRVMVEGGAKILSSFLQSNFYDRLVWFRAPCLLGGDSKPALASLHLEHLADRIQLRRVSAQAIGPDLLEIYEKD